jgi:hypothetical protein
LGPFSFKYDMLIGLSRDFLRFLEIFDLADLNQDKLIRLPAER